MEDGFELTLSEFHISVCLNPESTAVKLFVAAIFKVLIMR
jgi:hypothetical protein